MQLIINNEQLDEEANVFDVSGKLVLNIIASKAKQSHFIDINSLRNGIYFIKIGTQVQKFIKE